tara:strand:- start:787 stop:1347 length:561 start_codon:yes stop_codon:yes gene_type:complete
MSAVIDTPLLIVGGGPAALIVATVVSGSSMGSLIVGHESVGGDELVQLDEAEVAVLKPHGVINVLRPYATSTEPFVITAALFEKVLKHHCVVNMNITVYDGMKLVDLKIVGDGGDASDGGDRDSGDGKAAREGLGARATISDGHSQWQVKADYLADTGHLSVDLNEAIKSGAALAHQVLGRLRPVR